MARYIDADKFKRHLEKAMKKMHLIGGVKGVGVEAVIKALEMQPTADVAPKSEVAREILEKLDRFINSNCIVIKDERGIKGYVTSGVHFAIAELKKKYTEGK